jgi:KDO2-lipid IV(A) lauroyltransferase
VKEFFNIEKKDPFAIAFAIDQSPANPEKCYWSQFLNQDTAIHFGAEKYAKEHNLPVYFARITQTDKHQYTLRFECVTTNPVSESHGYITEESSRILEEQIRSQPEFWLWSHKRWKHKRPAGL